MREHAQQVAPALARCKQGMLHGDFNDENVLVDGEQMVGLLDFGDALRGAFVQDVAITIAYAVQHDRIPNLPLAAAIVRGYANRRAAAGRCPCSEEASGSVSYACQASHHD
uniref:Protein kinase domain-containing protein n=1 Tax=Calcidiscus leptoporus TaxID=127549 RepID=A0A7S0IK37_9EUKA